MNNIDKYDEISKRIEKLKVKINIQIEDNERKIQEINKWTWNQLLKKGEKENE